MLYTMERFIAAIRIGQHRSNTNTLILAFSPSSFQGLGPFENAIAAAAAAVAVAAAALEVWWVERIM